MQTLTAEIIEQWKAYLEDERSDVDWMNRQQERDAQRTAILPEMRTLLASFMNGDLTVEDLRATFDRKTRSEWDYFGFKGMNGAMFLNKLVKHVPDDNELARELRKVIGVPANVQGAQEAIQHFNAFLQSIISAGKGTRKNLELARIPFFLSAWWHIQSPEEWPVYYLTALYSLKHTGLFHDQQNLAENYVYFRKIFLELAGCLRLSIWELEHVCAWLYESHKKPDVKTGQVSVSGEASGQKDATQVVAIATDEDEGAEIAPTPSVHTQTQWALAKIGKSFGCKVWIAKNDHSRVYQGETLGNLSIPDLPFLGMDTASQKIIRLIDVVWLKGNNQVVAAFEVEHSTSIYSGLLRLADLAALAPNLIFPLYIAVPEDRKQLVSRELARPTFQTLELHHRCSFFTIEDLLREMDSILRWAKDPAAINELAEKVGDVI